MQDRSFTLESGVSYSNNTDLFSGCDSSCFSNYHYLIIDVVTPYSGTNNLRFLRFYNNNNENHNFTTSLNTSFSIYSLASDTSNLKLAQNFTPSGTDIILTLTNSYQTGISPSGSLSISENGTYDVTNYAEAVVDVPSSGGSDYHEDLVMINNSILICGAVCLVIYFFYCIYRMIIKPLGGR